MTTFELNRKLKRLKRAFVSTTIMIVKLLAMTILPLVTGFVSYYLFNNTIITLLAACFVSLFMIFVAMYYDTDVDY